ncbi:kunitz-type serine protease inhibitor bitisilin-3-like [Haemaphysalis longicornis]
MNYTTISSLISDPDYGICAKPRIRGTCDQSQAGVRVRFNPDKRVCELYRYGGCRAEENSFKTYEECYKKCNDFVTNPCVLPIVPASSPLCRGEKSSTRYGYNAASKKCESFGFADCNGNKNSFVTRHECLQTCASIEED